VQRFSVRNPRGKSQGGAPVGEEEDMREKEALGSPSMMNSSGDDCRHVDLRRGNSAISLHLERKNQKERREKVWGSYSIRREAFNCEITASNHRRVPVRV
jgi:hypothetical protein